MFQIFGNNPNKVNVQQSSNFKNGAFNNLEPTVMLTEEASLLKMTKDFIKVNKNRVPKALIPSVKNRFISSNR
jgi:hypothetical protein